MNLPEGIPIKDLSWEQLQQVQNDISGWVYPRRNISPFIEGFPVPQQIALSLYIYVAIGIFITGLILPFLMDNWWWALLMAGAIAVWKANRKSMEDFFLQNLQEDREFYDAIRQTSMGESVKVVLRQDRL